MEADPMALMLMKLLSNLVHALPHMQTAQILGGTDQSLPPAERTPSSKLLLSVAFVKDIIKTEEQPPQAKEVQKVARTPYTFEEKKDAIQEYLKSKNFCSRLR